MAKYPCGVCSILVKYKAVSCNSCKKWFHTECVYMSNEKFKILTKTQPHTWTCEKCSKLSVSTSESELNNESITLSELSNRTVNLSLQDLEDSILQNDFQDSEEMAGKTGLVMLQEMSFLKNKNSELVAKITSLEAIIEDYENNMEKCVSKTEALQQNISELESQLVHEKQHHIEIQNIFEEHDKNQSETLNDLESKLKNQNILISTLQNKLEKSKTLNQHSSKKNSETQTQASSISHEEHVLNATSLVIEVGLLKKSQREMGAKFETLESSIKELLSKKMEEEKSVILPQKERKFKKKQETRQTLKKNNTLNRNLNVFSVSLQAEKHKTKTQINQQLEVKTQHTKTQETKQNQTWKPLNTARKPPCTAQKLENGETVEDFFNRNVKKAVLVNKDLTLIPTKTHQKTKENIATVTRNKIQKDVQENKETKKSGNIQQPELQRPKKYLSEEVLQQYQKFFDAILLKYPRKN